MSIEPNMMSDGSDGSDSRTLLYVQCTSRRSIMEMSDGSDGSDSLEWHS